MMGSLHPSSLQRSICVPLCAHLSSLACDWAAEELGLKQPEIGLKLGMTQAAVSMAILRGKLFAAENNIYLE
jgi:hypothetical protein